MKNIDSLHRITQVQNRPQGQTAILAEKQKKIESEVARDRQSGARRDAGFRPANRPPATR